MSKANKQSKGQPAPDKPASVQSEFPICADASEIRATLARFGVDSALGIKRPAVKVPQIEALPGCGPLGIKPAAGPVVTVTSRKVKAAWIRRADVPAGQPATGHFDCECGRQVQAGYFGDGPNVCCECGLVYDSEGWIKGPAGL